MAWVSWFSTSLLAAFFRIFYNKFGFIILIFSCKVLNFLLNIYSLLKCISFITITLFIIGNYI